jgi:uncharacterized protein (DUF952 family)
MAAGDGLAELMPPHATAAGALHPQNTPGNAPSQAPPQRDIASIHGITLDRITPPRHDTGMLIYKIFRAPEWADLQTHGETRGAPIDIADGYVHFSTAAQAAETAAKHFTGEQNLILLALDADNLGDTLIWEPSRGGALFPHLYRPLRLSDVLWHRPLPLENGQHRFPPEMT